MPTGHIYQSHGVQESLSAQPEHQIVDGELRHLAASLRGGAAQVRGDGDVVHGEEGVVARQRLGVGHVQAGRVYLPLLLC